MPLPLWCFVVGGVLFVIGVFGAMATAGVYWYIYVIFTALVFFVTGVAAQLLTFTFK